METIEIPVFSKNKIYKALIDSDDYYKVSMHKWHLNKGYAAAKYNGRTIYMHRLILKTPKNLYTDHINRNRLDNRKCNLRICTLSQNYANTERRTNLPKGVSFNKNSKKNPYTAQIYKDNKKIYLGSFPTKEKAHKAYCNKGKELFGEFFNSGS